MYLTTNQMMFNDLYVKTMNQRNSLRVAQAEASTCGVPGLLRQPSDISLWHPIDLGVVAVEVRMVHPMGIKWGYYGDTGKNSD